MLNPPSPHSAITWRERSSACIPLACASAVPTAALLKEPMIRCEPLCRIQLADHSVFRPVSRTNMASRLARSLTVLATACGWMRSLLRRIGLLQPLVPFSALLGHLVPKALIGLWRDVIEQRF